MNSYMINELKEAPIIIDKIINLDEDIFLNIIKNINNKNIILTGMGSSYFISEIGTYFFKNIILNRNISSYSADEIEKNNPTLNKNHFIITFSQSGNTKEVSNLLIILNKKGISNFSLINNLNGEHIILSDNNFFFDIGFEKSPVSTKYVIYSVLFLYKLSLISGKLNKNISLLEKNKYLDDIRLLKDFSENVFDKYENILNNLTNKYILGDNFLIIGNGLNYFVAKEISLKIRETIGIITSYDNIGQLNHGGINSISNKTICILLENDKKIFDKIQKRSGKIITIGKNKNSDINFNGINEYIDSIQKIILLDYFIHILAGNLKINTDNKSW